MRLVFFIFRLFTVLESVSSFLLDDIAASNEKLQKNGVTFNSFIFVHLAFPLTFRAAIRRACFVKSSETRVIFSAHS